MPSFDAVNDTRQEQLSLRPTSISVAAAEAYAPNSANSLEQRSLSSANAYLPPLQIFDGQSGSTLNPASNASDASYFTNERVSPIAIQTGSDSSNTPAQSLMNLFAQQDAMLNSNPSDAPAPSTNANDLQTGLSNPVQGLVNLTNDLNPFKWL